MKRMTPIMRINLAYSTCILGQTEIFKNLPHQPVGGGGSTINICMHSTVLNFSFIIVNCEHMVALVILRSIPGNYLVNPESQIHLPNVDLHLLQSKLQLFLAKHMIFTCEH